MGKKKENDNDIYRKKSYTPLFQRDFAKELLDFFKKAKKLSGRALVELFEKHPDIKAYLSAPKEIEKILQEVVVRGANLKLICDTLKQPELPPTANRNHPFATSLFATGIQLNPNWEQAVQNYEEKRKDFLKHDKNIRRALTTLIKLSEIPEATYAPDLSIPDFNRDFMLMVVTQLKPMVYKYLDLLSREVVGYLAIHWGLHKYSPTWKKDSEKGNILKKNFNPRKQISKIWNEKIIILVDEFKRLGFSDKQAYLKTAELLHTGYPHLSKDKDPDLIRQRYTYQKSIIDHSK